MSSLPSGFPFFNFLHIQYGHLFSELFLLYTLSALCMALTNDVFSSPCGKLEGKSLTLHILWALFSLCMGYTRWPRCYFLSQRQFWKVVTASIFNFSYLLHLRPVVQGSILHPHTVKAWWPCSCSCFPERKHGALHLMHQCSVRTL